MSADGYDGEIISYVVDGEVLDKLLGFLPFETPGEKQIIGKLDNSEETTISERIDRHLLNSIIDILVEESTKHNE